MPNLLYPLYSLFNVLQGDIKFYMKYVACWRYVSYFNEQVDFKISSKLIQASKVNKRRWLKWLLACKTEYICTTFCGTIQGCIKIKFQFTIFTHIPHSDTIQSWHSSRKYRNLHNKYHIAEKFGGGSLANRLFSSIWQKKVWWINRLPNRLLIVITDLDGYSLANHG